MLQYDYVKDILERRDPFRAGHIEGAKKMAALGKIVLAGAYTDPTDGASFCFRDVTRYGTGATILSTKMDTAAPSSPSPPPIALPRRCAFHSILCMLQRVFSPQHQIDTSTHREEVEDFVKDDPYVTNGLVSSYRIRAWNVGK